MDDRKAAVLNALVDEHIRTGHPVSSRAVLEVTKLNVSSATIRNDLAALEAEGFVTQPHISAGRVPTEKGFRYYVDTTDPARLRARTRDRINEFFMSFHHELRSLRHSLLGFERLLVSRLISVSGRGRGLRVRLFMETHCNLLGNFRQLPLARNQRPDTSYGFVGLRLRQGDRRLGVVGELDLAFGGLAQMLHDREEEAT